MLCSECGFSNRESDRFCQDCGAALTLGAQTGDGGTATVVCLESYPQQTSPQPAVPDREESLHLPLDTGAETSTGEDVTCVEAFEEPGESTGKELPEGGTKVHLDEDEDEDEEEGFDEEAVETGYEEETVIVENADEVTRPAVVNPALLLMLGGGVVLLAIIAGILIASRQSAPVAEPGNSGKIEEVPKGPDPKPAAIPTPPEGMVYVPGATFTMGSDRGDELSRPGHAVSVKPFFMDRTEVTNAQYQQFIDAKAYSPPPFWRNGHFPAGKGDLPVVNVNWYDASAYAQWAGKRLPTESEWELAARGTDERLYPWGNQWQPDIAVTKESHLKGPLVVGNRLAGASPCGALDMCGNVIEWIADDFTLYPSSPAKPPEGDNKVLRGGGFKTPHDLAYVTYRGYNKPLYREALIGFRCASDIP